jgi:hypothetical protein
MKVRNKIRADVVGPVCESGDFIALNREIADVKGGEPARLHERRRVRIFNGIKLQLSPLGGGGTGARKNA